MNPCTIQQCLPSSPCLSPSSFLPVSTPSLAAPQPTPVFVDGDHGIYPSASPLTQPSLKFSTPLLAYPTTFHTVPYSTSASATTPVPAASAGNFNDNIAITLSPREEIWREPVTTHTTIQACQPIFLKAGTIVVASTTIKVPERADGQPPIQFQPFCINGRPVLGTVPRLPDQLARKDSIVSDHSQAWENWVATSEGKFATSIIPVMYSLAASAVTCWILTLVVLGFRYKRTLLYKLALMCSSVYLLVIMIRSTSIVREQFHHGYLDSMELRHILRTSKKINILNLTFNTILYLGQVQTAMYLFSRQMEKRLVLWIGCSLTIIAQTIWGVSVLHPALSLNSLPAFSYLFQIALSVMYLCCAVFFAITAHLYALHPSLLLVTLLALLAASSTIILFIVDLANIWVIEWADSLSWITTVFSIVMVREWADRVYTMQRRHEKTGVLGRQLFEDEVVKSFFSQKDPSLASSNNGDPSISTSSQNIDAPKQNPYKGKDILRQTSTVRTTSRSPAELSGTTATTTASSHTRISPSARTMPGVKMHHAVLDLNFDNTAEDGAGPARYLYHKITHSLIYFSDLVINIGLSVSRPLSSVSNPSTPIAHNPIAAPDSGDDTISSNRTTNSGSTRHESMTSEAAEESQPLEKFYYPQRRMQ